MTIKMPSAATPDELIEKIRALSPSDQLALAIVKKVSTELEILHIRGRI